MNFFEKALETAARISLPIPLVAFAIVFTAFAYWAALRSRKQTAASLLLRVLIAVVVLGLAPIGASTYLQSRGMYRVDVVVRGTDGRPVKEAQVTASIGAQIKKGDSYWEIDIPTQNRPADRRVRIFAAEGARAGDATVSLEDSLNIQTTIDLVPLPYALIRGFVKDAHGKGVSDAHVSVSGYKDGTTTDQWGNFELPAHAVEGQMITLRAEKDGWSAQISVPAGAQAELTLKKN